MRKHRCMKALNRRDGLLKVLLITSSLDDGGVARIVSEMTLFLPDDWTFDIMLVHSDDIRYPYRGNIIDLGIKEPKSRTGLLYAAKVFLKRYRLLRKIKKENSYDVCVSFMDSSNVCNILSGNKYCKTVAVVENHMTQQAKYDWKYRIIVGPLIKLFYNRADRVIACSDESCMDLIKNYGVKKDKLDRIYCSLDMKSIEEKGHKDSIPNEESKWFSDGKTVVTAGRLCKQKGQWHLVRAFGKVVKTIPDAKLVIFGEGDLKDYLIGLIRYHKLEDSVLIHEYTKILPSYITKSAIYAMPSLYEGFPTAMLMAMACGAPCVASDFISGAREQLSPGYDGEIQGYYMGEYGVLCEALDGEILNSDAELTSGEDGLADAIIELLSNDNLRSHYSHKALERCKIFDSVKIYDEWKDQIQKICYEA